MGLDYQSFLVIEDEYSNIEQKVRVLENKGWKYFESPRGKDIDNPNYKRVRIKTTNGKLLARYQIDEILQKLEIGNTHQIEALHALKYLYLKQISEGIRDLN